MKTQPDLQATATESQGRHPGAVDNEKPITASPSLPAPPNGQKAPPARKRTALTIAFVIVLIAVVTSLPHLLNQGGSSGGSAVGGGNRDLVVKVAFTNRNDIGPLDANSSLPGVGAHCFLGDKAGVDSYADVAHAQLVVSDGGGAVLAEAESPGGGIMSSNGCDYTFAVGPVKKVSQYAIQLGAAQGVDESLATLQSDGWNLSLSL